MRLFFYTYKGKSLPSQKRKPLDWRVSSRAVLFHIFDEVQTPDNYKAAAENDHEGRGRSFCNHGIEDGVTECVKRIVDDCESDYDKRNSGRDHLLLRPQFASCGHLISGTHGRHICIPFVGHPTFRRLGTLLIYSIPCLIETCQPPEGKGTLPCYQSISSFFLPFSPRTFFTIGSTLAPSSIFRRPFSIF